MIHGDYNVLVVDWGAGSALPYTKAVANTRLVGLEIAHLANTLIVRRRVVHLSDLGRPFRGPAQPGNPSQLAKTQQ